MVVELLAEILGFARELLENANPLPLPSRVIDVCGTGGTGMTRFNTSTAVAFVLAAALYCFGAVQSLRLGYERSRDALRSGAVRETFFRFRQQANQANSDGTSGAS